MHWKRPALRGNWRGCDEDGGRAWRRFWLGFDGLIGMVSWKNPWRSRVGLVLLAFFLSYYHKKSFLSKSMERKRGGLV